jgi:cell division septum initiation protein DivIVA
MANEAEELLAAEQAVQQLLKELEELKKQIGGYDQARQSLDAVRLTLQTMVERTQTLSEKTHLAITVLSKIGTPEIIARVDGVKTAIKDLGIRFDDAYKLQVAAAEEQTKRLNRVATIGALLAGLALLVAVFILTKMILK